MMDEATDLDARPLAPVSRRARGLLVAGVALLAAGTALGVALLWHYEQARSLSKIARSTGGGSCVHPIASYPAALVVSKGEQRALAITLRNTDASGPCEIKAQLKSGKVDVRDDALISRTLAPGESATVSWLVSPSQAGLYEVKVEAGLDSATIGISVPSFFGLDVQTTESIAWLAGIAGGIASLGRAVPWIWERMEKTLGTRRRRKR